MLKNGCHTDQRGISLSDATDAKNMDILQTAVRMRRDVKSAQKVIKVDAKERSSVTTAREVMEQESGTVQCMLTSSRG